MSRMAVHPRLADGVHPVRAAAHRRRLDPAVTRAALDEHADVPLPLDALDVVVRVDRRELGVRRAVTRLARHAAVADGEAIERQTHGRRVRRGRERLVHGLADVVRRVEHRGVADLAVVARRGAGVAALTRRLVQPAEAIRVADRAHRAVTALALDRERAVGRDRGAHDAAKTAGERARMAAIAGRTIVGRVEDLTGQRIGDARVPAVHRLRERLHAGVAAGAERRGRMTAGAENRLSVDDRGRIETVAAVADRRPRGERRGEDRIRRLELVMLPQNVEAHLALRIRIGHPAACRHRGSRRPRCRRMTGPAVHLVRHRQHDVGHGEHRAARGASDEPHHRVGILLVRVVVGRERDALGDEPAGRRVPGHRPRRCSPRRASRRP